MGVKANWHNVSVSVGDDDPFAEDAPIEQVTHVPTAGLPIDLNASRASLDARLVSNLRDQSRLYNEDVDCPIRWKDGASCHACPVSQHADDTPHGLLCRLAREEESITTLLAVRSVDGGGR